MKKHIAILSMMAISMPLMAQETNNVTQAVSDGQAKEAQPQNQERPRTDRQAEFQARQLQLMEKALKEIGVTDEQRDKIFALQEEHMEKMKASWIRLSKARRELSRLQNEGATEEQLDAAIQKVSEAQTEQLKVLVHNRMEMERILGKEKYEKFMEIAQMQFKKHGRRPGTGMPPLPLIQPPIPSENDKNSDDPPAPPSTDSTGADQPAPPTE